MHVLTAILCFSIFLDSSLPTVLAPACVTTESLVMSTTSATNRMSPGQPSSVVVFYGVVYSIFCMGHSDEKSIFYSVVEDQYSLGITGISLLCPGMPIPKFAPDMQGQCPNSRSPSSRRVQRWRLIPIPGSGPLLTLSRPFRPSSGSNISAGGPTTTHKLQNPIPHPLRLL